MLLLSLPRLKLRSTVKDEFDKKLSEGMPVSDHLSYGYYLIVVRYLDLVGIIYLFGTFLVVLSPWHNGLYIASYGLIMFATSMWVALMICSAIVALLRTLVVRVSI
ncbi:hypothetical protein ES703_116067 [subsurface metagenome]